jgi:hypothetical protein
MLKMLVSFKYALIDSLMFSFLLQSVPSLDFQILSLPPMYFLVSDFCIHYQQLHTILEFHLSPTKSMGGWENIAYVNS